jgi:hypothetical protein
VKNDGIKVVKIWKLRCKKCKSYANFDKFNLLNLYLRERVQQKLIYSKYRNEFFNYSQDKEQDRKELKNHEQSLCEKCKSLGSYCGKNK